MASIGEPSPRPGRSAVRRVAAYAIGLLMLVAAVIAVSGRTDALRDAIAAARTASPWLVVAVILLPLVNILVISASFWSLTSRFGPIGFLEMVALIVSSWLLNHLPLRPGLVGRVGYHRAVNGIPITASLRVIVEQFVCGVAALGIMVLVAMLCAPLGASTAIALLLAAGAVIAVAGLLLRHRAAATRRSPLVPCLAAAFGFRLLDMTLWIVRYLCLFTLVGSPLDLTEAAAVTAASQAAMLSPIPIGLREWAVGAVHGLLGAASNPGHAVSMASVTPGVAADLANRAAELLVAVPLGVLASLWLMRRTRSARSGAPTHPAASSSV